MCTAPVRIAATWSLCQCARSRFAPRVAHAAHAVPRHVAGMLTLLAFFCVPRTVEHLAVRTEAQRHQAARQADAKEDGARGGGGRRKGKGAPDQKNGMHMSVPLLELKSDEESIDSALEKGNDLAGEKEEANSTGGVHRHRHRHRTEAGTGTEAAIDSSALHRQKFSFAVVTPTLAFAWRAFSAGKGDWRSVLGIIWPSVMAACVLAYTRTCTRVRARATVCMPPLQKIPTPIQHRWAERRFQFGKVDLVVGNKSDIIRSKRSPTFITVYQNIRDAYVPAHR